MSEPSLKLKLWLWFLGYREIPLYFDKKTKEFWKEHVCDWSEWRCQIHNHHGWSMLYVKKPLDKRNFLINKDIVSELIVFLRFGFNISA